MAQAKQDMGSGSVKKLMLQLMIPAVVAQVVNLLYNIVDRIYIGHIAGIGAAALTGVGLFTPILMLLNAFAMLVGAGGAPRTAIALGQGDKEQAEKIISNSFTMLLLFSVVLTVVFYAGAPTLLRLFGAAGAGHEPLHHHAGLCQDQYAYHRHRCGHQHYSRPHPDLWSGSGRAGRCHCQQGDGGGDGAVHRSGFVQLFP